MRYVSKEAQASPDALSHSVSVFQARNLYQRLAPNEPPDSHRRNLIFWVLHGRRRKREAFRPYKLVSAYIRDTYQIKAKRLPDMAGMLRSLFGPLAGAWLFSNLHRAISPDTFEITMSRFKEPFVPHAAPSGYDVEQVRQQVKDERVELLKAQRQFRRDEQHANRVALIASLRTQAGPVNARGYTQRWYRDHTKYQRYDRVRNRFEHLFGDRAAAALDDTTVISRLLLAQMLKDIDREEMKRV